MKISDHLKHLSQVGTVVACSNMTLLAGDDDPPIVIGTGEIRVLSTTSFGYTLHGTPSDFSHACRSLRRIEQDPYDSILRERLIVTTSDGLKLMAGWTIPDVHTPGDGSPWIWTGEIDALSFRQDGTPDPGTEVAYALPQKHRARIIFRRFFPIADDGGLRTKSLDVLGSKIVLTLDDDSDLLLLEAPESEMLKPPYAENWLGEPLRILFGQPIYPRFVIRRSRQDAMAWVRPSPAWSSDSDACALWQGSRAMVDGPGFWENYRRLLTFVARARDEQGHPNFEANKLTELYGEVMQAAHASRWIWALAYASAVEAVVKMLHLERVPPLEMDPRAFTDFKHAIGEFNIYIDKWQGDSRPKEPAKAAARRLLTTSTVQALRKLVADGSVSRDEFRAWESLRNRVMHGSLVSPYSSAEEDKLLLDLAGLFHALTRRLLTDVDMGAGQIN